MFRSVTQSKQQEESKRALHRLEGVAVALVIFFGIFYALGWLRL